MKNLLQKDERSTYVYNNINILKKDIKICKLGNYVLDKYDKKYNFHPRL